MAAEGIRAGRAFVELGAEDAPLRKVLDGIAARFKSWGGAIRDLGMKIAGIGIGASVALSSTVVLFQAMGDAMAKAAARTGTTAKTLSALAYAADSSGASFEDLEGGIRRVQKTLADAIGGSKQAQEVLTQLGLKVDSFKGKSPDEQFKMFADAIGSLKDPTVKTAMAMAVFGKSGATLIPLLNEGSAGINELMARAKELGLVMSDEDAAAAEEMNDRMSELAGVLKYTAFTIGAALAPAVKELVVGVTNAVVSVRKFIDEHRELVTAVGLGLAAFTGLGIVMINTGVAMDGIAKLILGLSATWGVMGKTIGMVLSPLKLLSPVAGVGLGVLKSGLGGVVPLLAKVGWGVLAMFNPLKLLTAVGSMIAGGIGSAVSAIAALGPTVAAALPVAGVVLLGAAVVGLAGYFLYTSGAAGQAFAAIKSFAGSTMSSVAGVFTGLWQRLKGIWTDVQVDAGIAFQGVRDAIMGGNWAMAGRIIWTTLKLEFQRGLQGFWDPLVKSFYNAKSMMLDAWSGTMSSLQEAWANAKLYLGSWDGLEAGVNKFVNWLTNTWQAAIEYLEGAFFSFLASGNAEGKLEEIRKKMKSEGKSDAAIEAEIARQRPLLEKNQADSAAQASRDRNNANRRSQYDAAQKALDSGLSKVEPEAYKQNAADLKKIDDERAKRIKQNADDLAAALKGMDPARSAMIDQLKKDLADMQGQMAKERAEADAKRQSMSDPKTREGVADESDRIAKKTFETAGTFNKSALFGLGGGNEMARTAKATEQSAQSLVEIARLARLKKQQLFG